MISRTGFRARIAAVRCSVFVIFLATGCAGSTPRNVELGFNDFKETQEVEIAGEKMKSFPAGLDCVYFEWVYGQKSSEWVQYSVGYQSEIGIRVSNSRGAMSLSRGAFRLFLSPTRSNKYDYTNMYLAPEVARKWIAETGSVTVEEFDLVPGKTYYARRHVESYWLPDPGNRPRMREATVLWISDAPFTDNPSPPITPAYKGWTH